MTENTRVQSYTKEFEAEKEALKRHLLTLGGGTTRWLLHDVILYRHYRTSPVLIVGESGSGKEFVAAALFGAHLDGKRSYLSLNCAALPDELLLSELFGHEKGAFTGASRRRAGILRSATRGLFLDEIDKSSLRFQNALLRYLRNGELRSLGSDESTILKPEERPIIVCATSARVESVFRQTYEKIDSIYQESLASQDLDESEYRLSQLLLVKPVPKLTDEAIKHVNDVVGRWSDWPKATMAADFINRIMGSMIVMPPLRERRGDLGYVFQKLLSKHAREYRIPIDRVSGVVLEFIMNYAWPRNMAEIDEFTRSAVMAYGAADNGALELWHCLHIFKHWPTFINTVIMGDSPMARADRPHVLGFLGIPEIHAAALRRTAISAAAIRGDRPVYAPIEVKVDDIDLAWRNLRYWRKIDAGWELELDESNRALVEKYLGLMRSEQPVGSKSLREALGFSHWRPFERWKRDMRLSYCRYSSL
jgi:hypothetical protein